MLATFLSSQNAKPNLSSGHLHELLSVRLPFLQLFPCLLGHFTEVSPSMLHPQSGRLVNGLTHLKLHPTLPIIFYPFILPCVCLVAHHIFLPDISLYVYVPV